MPDALPCAKRRRFVLFALRERMRPRRDGDSPLTKFFMRNLQEKRGIDTAGKRNGDPTRLPQQRAQPLQFRLHVICVWHRLSPQDPAVLQTTTRSLVLSHRVMTTESFLLLQTHFATPKKMCISYHISALPCESSMSVNLSPDCRLACAAQVPPQAKSL